MPKKVDDPAIATAVPFTPTRNTGVIDLTHVRQEWYYRENAGDTLVGPMSFEHAERGARYLSKLKDHSGLSELCTILGDRPGDPLLDAPKIFVVFMFIRGKRTLGGRSAVYHSERGLPPTT